LLNSKRIFLYLALFYSLFGYASSIITDGMKGAYGPLPAIIFIASLLALDIILIKRRFAISKVNMLNLAAILPFYFFAISLPLWISCPSPLAAPVAFLAFSGVTFLPFMLIVYLVRSVFIRIAGLKNSRGPAR